ATLERALLGIAARPLEEELGAFPPAEAANGFGVAGHRVLTRLDAAPLGRAAAVVRDGGDVGDRADFESGGLERPDRLLTAGAGALHVDLDLAHAVLHGAPGSAVSRERSSIGRALAGALEA